MGEKMRNLIVSMLFLTAVVCQTTGQAQDYNQLDSVVKTFVDKAILKANQQYSYGHLNFYRIHQVPQVSSMVRMDVRLKATTCRKVAGANEHRHRPECPFKRLEIRCLVCEERNRDTFIDCVRRKDENTRHQLWTEHCFREGTWEHATLA